MLYPSLPDLGVFRTFSTVVSAIVCLVRLLLPRLLHRFADLPLHVSEKQIPATATSAAVPLTVYHPPLTTSSSTSPPPCIILIHGLSISGPRDERITSLASALALTNHLVITPHISSLLSHSANPSVITHLTDVIVRISEDASLVANSAQVHLCAPCISAGLLLIAAANLPPEGPTVGGVLLIGPYADVSTVQEFAFSNPAADPYARGAMILNAIPVLPQEEAAKILLRLTSPGPLRVNDQSSAPSSAPHSPSSADVPDLTELCSLLNAYLIDSHLGPASARLPPLLHGVSNSSRSIFLTLTSSSGQLSRLDASLRRYPELQRWQKAMSPVGNLDGLRCGRVVALHGRTDDVVPSDETARLGQYMQQCAGIRDVRTLVTPLMSHGDRDDEGLGIRGWISAVVDIVHTLASFFDETQLSNAEVHLRMREESKLM